MPLTSNAPAPVVISLVLRLRESEADCAAVFTALLTRPEIELGAMREGWLPLVAETADPRELHAWLESLPGIAQVDVTFVEIVPESKTNQ
jgi:hypothetical protein